MMTRLKSLWQGLRRLSGDDAYERYLAYHARRHGDDENGPGCKPLGRAEFFKQMQQEKWNGVKRCC